MRYAASDHMKARRREDLGVGRASRITHSRPYASAWSGAQDKAQPQKLPAFPPSCSILIALTLAGCNGEDELQKPTIERFEAQPMIVDLGGDTKLVWAVRDAERIFVRTGTTSLAETVEPEGVVMARALREDTQFTLEATNSVGSSFAT